MKKLISLMLALIMVLSLATVASAEEWDGTYANSAEGSFELTKKYTGTDRVTETLQFEVKNQTYKEDKDATAVTDTSNITVPDVEVDGTTATITVNYPAFSKAGFYYFDIIEKEGDILAMEYSETTINCVIHVIYDNENHALKVNSVGVVDENGKISEYENKLNTTSLTLDKVVDGNMASETAEFTFSVVISLPEGSDRTSIDTTIINGGDKGTYYADATSITLNNITLCANDDVYTISGIPVGAKIVVTETDPLDYEFKSATGGTVNTDAKTVTINAASKDGNAVEITNYKNESVSTGIVTDSAPYIILIAVCAVAAVAFVLKRRNAVEF